MIYLLAEMDEYELPLAVAGSMYELAKICGTYASAIYKALKKQRETRVFHGVPARVYEIPEEEITKEAGKHDNSSTGASERPPRVYPDDMGDREIPGIEP